jgi:hypothetical protein
MIGAWIRFGNVNEGWLTRKIHEELAGADQAFDIG